VVTEITVEAMAEATVGDMVVHLHQEVVGHEDVVDTIHTREG